MNPRPNGLCWGCGSSGACLEWCPEHPKRHREIELDGLIRTQQKDMTLCARFQPPEWINNRRVLSYSGDSPFLSDISTRHESWFEFWENSGNILEKIA